MSKMHGSLQKQGKFLLENKQYAILYASLLAILPYTVWLSVAIIALITLRKGWRDGLVVCGAGLLISFAC